MRAKFFTEAFSRIDICCNISHFSQKDNGKIARDAPRNPAPARPILPSRPPGARVGTRFARIPGSALLLSTEQNIFSRLLTLMLIFLTIRKRNVDR
ncbi:MAG TPA: hypothetical protein PL181_16095, partial [bacterium]|nr:hypothetical protein [bacterium]